MHLFSLFNLAIFACGLSDATVAKTAKDYTYVGILSGKQGRSTSSSVYYISNTASTWTDARFSCEQAFNGQLLSIEDAVENKFIRDLMIKHSVGQVWTSGAYNPSSASWVWTSTFETMIYTQWRTPPTTSNLYRVATYNDIFNSYWAPQYSESSLWSICEVTV